MKTYPFSVKRHQHDVEFRYNRLSNILDDMRSGEIEATSEQMDEMEGLLEQLDELRSYVFGSYPVCYLPGKLYGLAKETVVWAEMARDETQRLKRQQAVQ